MRLNTTPSHDKPKTNPERRNTHQGFSEGKSLEKQSKVENLHMQKETLERRPVIEIFFLNKFLKEIRGHSIDRTFFNERNTTETNIAREPLSEWGLRKVIKKLENHEESKNGRKMNEKKYGRSLSYWENYTEKGKEEHEVLLARLKSFRRKVEVSDDEENKILSRPSYDSHEKGLKTEIDVLDQEINDLQSCIRRQLVTNEDIE